MAVAINDCWKVPCGYFFIKTMDSVERANLIRVCIEKLNDVGMDVAALVCDGPSVNIKMMTELGASLDPLNLRPYFPHPSCPEKKIHILLDICTC